MFDLKMKWTKVFDSTQELHDQLGEKDQTVSHSAFGPILWVRSNELFHAFKNKCPHQNKPLDDCWISEGHVVCPFHRYHFSVETGRGHSTSMFKFEVKIEDDAVWIGKEVFRIF